LFREKKVSAVILAAGSSSRFGRENKIYAELLGIPVIKYAVNAFINHPLIDEVVVVAASDCIELMQGLLKGKSPKKLIITEGGKTRSHSSINGISMASGDIVLTHDGARPFVTEDIINRVIEGVYKFGGTVAALQATDTIKICDDNGRVVQTTKRKNTWCVQTPQGFNRLKLIEAYNKTDLSDFSITDDAMVYEMQGLPVWTVQGAKYNMKITTKEDLDIAIGWAEKIELMEEKL
jgi:2-C-methyl-D-erythritol 4-phosphate cytidylyltransferase